MVSSLSAVCAVEGSMLAEETESEMTLDITKGLLDGSNSESDGYAGSVWAVASGGDLDRFLLLEIGCILPGLNQQLVWATQRSKEGSLSINDHCIWTQALLLLFVLLSSFPLSHYTHGVSCMLCYTTRCKTETPLTRLIPQSTVANPQPWPFPVESHTQL